MRIFNRIELKKKPFKLISSHLESEIYDVIIDQVAINGIRMETDFLIPEGTYTTFLASKKISFTIKPAWYKENKDSTKIIAGYKMKFEDPISFTYWTLFNQAAYKIRQSNSLTKAKVERNLFFQMPEH